MPSAGLGPGRAALSPGPDRAGRTARAGVSGRHYGACTMLDERTFAVTLVKTGSGLPLFEVGAYRYTADWLPQVGDTIAIRSAAAPDGSGPELQGYVTRINPASDTPISVIEVEGQMGEDDLVVSPAEHGYTY